MTKHLDLYALPGIPEIRPGDDLATIIETALAADDRALLSGDILVLAQKIVSKAEGRQVRLAAVTPTPAARTVAARTAKDPRLVELILQESDGISRERPGLIIAHHRLGFTCANAGIDRSNVDQLDGDDAVLLLPRDPDASAARLHARLSPAAAGRLGVIISDSHGRPFRRGTVGVAIGAAGLPPLRDLRGEPDRFGYALQHTEVALADEVAAAAGLLMGQAAEGQPIVLVRGLDWPATSGSARELVRAAADDLYR